MHCTGHILILYVHVIETTEWVLDGSYLQPRGRIFYLVGTVPHITVAGYTGPEAFWDLMLFQRFQGDSSNQQDIVPTPVHV